MSDLPPLSRDQRKVDADHLKLLTILHFVGAGRALVGILFLFAHYAFMRVFFAKPRRWEGQKGGPLSAEFFAAFKGFYRVFGVWLVASCVLHLVSGLSLRAGRQRTFSLVVAGVNCLHLPLGTGLGVFPRIVLLRDSVREWYEA